MTSATVDEPALAGNFADMDRRPTGDRSAYMRPWGGPPPTEPLAHERELLAETAPTSKHLERHARAMVRVHLGPRFEAIVHERTCLVQQEIEGTITPAQRKRLEVLRWHVDQYEEAMLGDHWDVVRSSIAAQAGLAREMQEFIAELKAVHPNVFKPRR